MHVHMCMLLIVCVADTGHGCKTHLRTAYRIRIHTIAGGVVVAFWNVIATQLYDDDDDGDNNVMCMVRAYSEHSECVSWFGGEHKMHTVWYMNRACACARARVDE